MLAETARRLGVRFPDAAVWIEERVERIAAAVGKQPVAPVLCHNDLGRRNFLDDGRLMLIDWEYAGMGDPYYDLANYAANQSSSAAEEEFIIGYYFGRITPARLARLRLMRIMSDYHEMVWCLVQSHISQQEVDFRGYAETTAAFLIEQLRDLHFEQLLIDVTRPD
jgi:thiamine kinase-like enzyme